MDPNKDFKQMLVHFSAIAFSEVFATSILVFITCLGSVSGMAVENITVVQTAITSGMAVMITIFVFGHVSGAHVNPSVSLAAVISGVLSLKKFVIYFVAQILGANFGYGLIKAITPAVHIEQDAAVCVHQISDSISLGQAYLTEFLLSLILVWANCAAWDRRNEHRTDSVPLKFGFLIAALTFAGAGYTGASMNPARSFAPALWNWTWKNHWVYWVGPISAGIFGGGTYKLIFSKPCWLERKCRRGSQKICNFNQDIRE